MSSLADRCIIQEAIRPLRVAVNRLMVFDRQFEREKRWLACHSTGALTIDHSFWFSRRAELVGDIMKIVGQVDIPEFDLVLGQHKLFPVKD